MAMNKLGVGGDGVHKLTTADGWEFNAQSFVNIKDTCYDLDDLSPLQREFVATSLNVQGLNAAYAGRAVFKAVGLPEFAEVFPALAGE